MEAYKDWAEREKLNGGHTERLAGPQQLLNNRNSFGDEAKEGEGRVGRCLKAPNVGSFLVIRRLVGKVKSLLEVLLASFVGSVVKGLAERVVDRPRLDLRDVKLVLGH